MIPTMEHKSDEMPKDRKKPIHPFGLVGLVKFTSNK